MNQTEAESLESLQVLLQQNPDSLTFARVADALLKNGRLDEAVRVCEEGVRRHPYYVTGHMILGKCYLQKKLFDQAEKEFKRVLLFDPKYVSAHRSYGELMREIGWDNTCEMSYRKILHIDPLDDKVSSVVDEFARKAEAGRPKETPHNLRKSAHEALQPTPPPEPRKTHTAIPMTDDDLLATAGADERELIPPKPETSPAPASPMPEPEIPDEATDASVRPLSKTDEARFSSILDDIFQDEVIDEKSERAGQYQRGDVDHQKPSSNTDTALAKSRPSPEIKPKADERPSDRTLVRQGPEDSRRSLKPARPLPPPPSHSLDFDASMLEPPDSNVLPPPHLRSRRPLEKEPEVQERTRPAASVIDELEALPGGAPLTDAIARDKIVTPTLGEIYAAQGQYAKAIGVFELLSKKDPGNRHFREKIDYLKKRLQES